MVWRHRGRKWWYGKLHTQAGWRDLYLGTKDKPTAEAIQRMLDGFRHQRRWDLLEAIGTRFSVGLLYDAHQHGVVDALLTASQDVDLAPYVPQWEQAARSTMGGQTVDQYLAQVRTLIPEGVPFPRSHATPERLSTWLYSRPVSSPTMRRYFAAAQSFFGYLVRLKVIPNSPLRDLDRPADNRPRIMWLSTADAQRVVDAAYEPYRSFFALLYGTGIEVSVACHLKVRDVDLKAREIFAPGTKSHCRERTVRVAEWAWPYVEAVVRGKLPTAPLFPKMKRNAPSWQHRRVTKILGLTDYQLRDSRHSWAVRAAKAGTPAEIIARQLGHVDAQMVFKIYGRFMPSQHDRDRWEQVATRQDQEAAK